MNTYLLWFLFILACVGIFYFLDRNIRPLVRALLSGPFNQFYLKHLTSSTRHEFDIASAEENIDRAWSGVVFEKVYQIGISSFPYTRREKNLDYIKAAVASKPQIGRKMADELIKVLPKQYRNLNFQSKLACYICELLDQQNTANHSTTQPLKPIHSTELDHITTLVSAWIAGTIYLFLSLYILDDFPPLWVAISNIVLFVLMVLPLYHLIGTSLAKLSTIGAIATVIILFLGAYATVAHNRIQPPLRIGLSSYGNPNAILTIHTSQWLTVDNIECDGEKISVLLSGQLNTPIRFSVDDDSFRLLNKDCGEITPVIEVTQTEMQAFEFYIAARDSSSFFKGKDEVKVTLFIVSPAGIAQPISNDVVRIKLEHWIWGMARNTYVALASILGTTALFLINYLLSKRST